MNFLTITYLRLRFWLLERGIKRRERRLEKEVEKLKRDYEKLKKFNELVERYLSEGW